VLLLKKKNLTLIVLFLIISISASLAYLSTLRNAKPEQNNLSATQPVSSEVKYAKEYKSASELMDKKDFIGAINLLEAIPAKDESINSKIYDAVKGYINDSIQTSDRYISEKKYAEAISAVDSMLDLYTREKDKLVFDKSEISLISSETNKKNLLKKSLDLKKSYQVSILMYHNIEDKKGDELYIPPAKFKEQLLYLKDNQYNVIGLDDLQWYYANDIPAPPKTVVITLDDAQINNYFNAYPILKELSLKATVFVITSTIDTNPAHITSSQIKEMNENNIDIESHTEYHSPDKKLALLPYSVQLQHLKESKESLEKLLNKQVNYVCYPYGSYNSDTLKAAAEVGYKIGVTTEEGRAEKSNGLLKLKRIYVSNNYSVDYFKNLIKY
jgi:Predicted xylanase/chitin deacetylase